MVFVNTRPATRAKPLTDFLQSQGVNVLDLPLLELVTCELSMQEYQYLTQINEYQALIFISETAVTYFFDFIQTQHSQLNPNLTIVAVGQKTAQIFKNAWQNFYPTSPNLIMPSQFNLPENNEGLLQLPIIQSLQKNNKVLILKGKDGRLLLKNTLIEKDIIVHEVDFYQRIFSANAISIFQKFLLTYESSEKIIVLITSLTAWRHWQKLLLTFPDNSLDVHYLVLQSRIAETVKESTLNFTVLSCLDPNEILEKLKFLP